jgi:serine/threonine protein kinase
VNFVVNDARPTSSALCPGVKIGGTYELVREIGSGSMGSVWKALHLTLGHQVAIKFLRTPGETTDRLSERFEREGKLCARLGELSPNIVRVTDMGFFVTPYVVMELLRGQTLHTMLAKGGVLPWQMVVEITTQLCRGVRVAHDAGVVHRDIKPANVFVCDSQGGAPPLVKLLDFGIAKMSIEQGEEQTTRVGMILGTPSYMSPEQVSGGEISSATDLWGIAAIVYRMTVGRPPFGSGTLSELAMRIVSAAAPPPSSLAPGLPASLDTWMAQGLAREPKARFADAIEMSHALSALAVSSAPTGHVAEPEASAVVPTPRPRRRASRRMWMVGGAVAVAAVGGALLIRALAMPSPARILAAAPSTAPTATDVNAAPSVPAATLDAPPASAADLAAAPPSADSNRALPGAAAPRADAPRGNSAKSAPPPRPASSRQRAINLWNQRSEL